MGEHTTNGKFDRVKYTNKYIKKNYDRLGILLPQGMKAKLVEEAKNRNMSTTKLIVDTLVRELGLDNQS